MLIFIPLLKSLQKWRIILGEQCKYMYIGLKGACNIDILDLGFIVLSCLVIISLNLDLLNRAQHHKS